MINLYENCQICGSKNPMGEPCVNCVREKILSKKEKLFTPEKINDYISKLDIQEGDVLVISTPENYTEDMSVGLSYIEEGTLLSKVQIVVIPFGCKLTTIRKIDADL